MLLCLCAAKRNTATKTRQLRGGPIGKCHQKGGDNDIHFAQCATLLELYICDKNSSNCGMVFMRPFMTVPGLTSFFPKLSIIERRQKPMAGQLTLLASNSPGFWALGGPLLSLQYWQSSATQLVSKQPQNGLIGLGLGRLRYGGNGKAVQLLDSASLPYYREQRLHIVIFPLYLFTFF